MKTLSDVAAFLKRNPGRTVMMRYDERSKKFEVEYDRTPAQSKYLDDALEGLSETLRRKDSGIRRMDLLSLLQLHQLKNNVATQAATPAWAQQTGSQHFNAPAQVTAACGTVTAAGGTCPVCNRAPRWSLSNGEFGCVDGTHSNWSAKPGIRYAFNCAGVIVWLEWNDSCWL